MTREGERFEAFVRRFQDMVYATALRLLGRPADAEDVAQTVFMRAYQRFDDVVESPAAAGWLRTVTTNMCLNYLTRHRRRWRLFSEMKDGARVSERLERETGSASWDGGSGGPPDEGEALTMERSELLQQALLALPDHQRVPIVLHHLEGQSYKEIAAALGVSLGKVKTDIHRGREALKDHVIND